jgi:hypothetical protein
MPKLLKSGAILLLTLLLASRASISQGITTPRTPSPAAEVKQTIGISTITVNYSRPSVEGREVWGKLVPYGWNAQGFGSGAEAPWRPAPTKIRSSNSHDAIRENRCRQASMVCSL